MFSFIEDILGIPDVSIYGLTLTVEGLDEHDDKDEEVELLGYGVIDLSVCFDKEQSLLKILAG